MNECSDLYSSMIVKKEAASNLELNIRYIYKVLKLMEFDLLVLLFA